MSNARKLTLSAILIALSIVLNEFLAISIPPTSSPLLKITFGAIPLFLIAYYCGISYSIIGAVLSDLIGVLFGIILNAYPFQIGYTISALISGIVFGLFNLFKNKLIGIKASLIFTIVVCVINLLVIPVFLFGFNKFDIERKFDSYEYILSIIFVLSSIIFIVLSFVFRKDSNSMILLFSFYINSVLVTLVLNPLWINMYNGVNYFVLLSTRLYKAPVDIALYFILTRLLLIPLNKLIKK